MSVSLYYVFVTILLCVIGSNGHDDRADIPLLGEGEIAKVTSEQQFVVILFVEEGGFKLSRQLHKQIQESSEWQRVGLNYPDNFTSRYISGIKRVEEGECEACKDAATVIEHVEVSGVQKYQSNSDADAALYSVTTQPSLVYIRNGVPIMYHEDIKEAGEITTWLESTSKSQVIEITEETFHDNTNKALVLFTRPSCTNIEAIVEAVAFINKDITVGKVDLEKSPRLVNMVAVTQCPQLLFILEGAIHRYEPTRYTVISVSEFVKASLKNEESILEEPSETFGSKISKAVMALKVAGLLFDLNIYVKIAVPVVIVLIILVIVIVKIVNNNKKKRRSPHFHFD